MVITKFYLVSIFSGSLEYLYLSKNKKIKVEGYNNPILLLPLKHHSRQEGISKPVSLLSKLK